MIGLESVSKLILWSSLFPAPKKALSFCPGNGQGASRRAHVWGSGFCYRLPGFMTPWEPRDWLFPALKELPGVCLHFKILWYWKPRLEHHTHAHICALSHRYTHNLTIVQILKEREGVGETSWKVEIDFLALREVLPVLIQNFLTLILDTILMSLLI